MKKNMITTVFTVLFMLCFSAASHAAEDVSSRVTTITGINVMENAIEIKGDKPFIYTIYKPSDPYRIVVEIPNVNLGVFKDIVKANNSWITEITPSQIESPRLAAKFEILLQSPFDFESRYLNNSLLVKVRNEGQSPGSELTRSELKAKVAELTKEIGSKTDAEQKEPSTVEDKVSAQKATEITEIGFDQEDGTVRFVIRGNGSMNPSVFTLKNRIVIDIPDVTMKVAVPSKVMPPVRGIRAGKYKDKTRLVVDMEESRDFDVQSSGETVIVSMKRSASLATAKKETLRDDPKNAEERKEPEAKVEENIEAREPEALIEGRYTGRKISLDFQDADIVPIFRLLADISGYNIVVDPSVRGRLTMKLINVPWDQALDIILKTFNLDKTVEGNIIRIAPAAVLAKEREEKAKRVEAAVKAEPLETRVFPVSYADVSAVETAIKNSKILTSRGSISVDKRTSSLIVKDIPSVFPQIEELLLTLDRPIPQVMIEARIVEVSASDSNNLGIQWGGKISATSTLATLGGFPTLNKGTFTGSPFLVDFPSGGVGAGAGTGFNFGILNPAKTMGLDLQLAALETMGKTKIISTPKIVTTDNMPAKISQGEDIPYPQATAEGTVSAAFKSVAISIEVTPHITPASSINMSVTTVKEDFKEFVNIGQGQAPRTTKIEGRTNVLVQNGETLVIGGVYKKKETDSESGVPGLMKVPILGWLFKNKSKTEDISELMIFITPRIVEKP